MRWVPFTISIRVVPERANRTTYMRSLQKIATQVYDEVVTDSTLSLATPGGGQHQSFGPQYGGIGGMTNGMAVKPQMGQSPAQLCISGFISSSTDNVAPGPEATVLFDDEARTGQYGAHYWDSLPTTGTNTLVTSIKGKFDTAMTAVLGSGADWKVFSIEVAGVRYGDRGLHYPPS